MFTPRNPLIPPTHMHALCFPPLQVHDARAEADELRGKVLAAETRAGKAEREAAGMRDDLQKARATCDDLQAVGLRRSAAWERGIAAAKEAVEKLEAVGNEVLGELTRQR
jgi:hypothetical protein